MFNVQCSIEDREAEACRTSREERRDHCLILHSLPAIGDPVFDETPGGMLKMSAGLSCSFGLFGMSGLSRVFARETRSTRQTTHEVWCGGAERGRTAASQFCSAPNDSTTTDDPERQTTTPEE